MRATLPLLLLAACSAAPSENAAAPAPAASPPAIAPAPASSASTTTTRAQASRVEEKTPDFTFTYAYPAIAAAPLAAWLDRDRAAARAEIAKQAADGRRESADGSYAFNPYESVTEWEVVTETSRFLSLSASTNFYSGGAHGDPGSRAVLWDKARGERLEPAAVFTSPAALQQALGDVFCARLNQARAARRGAPVTAGADDPFNDCPKVSETTVILGSTDRRTIDRVGLLVGPYVAGPYAEGSYDLTVPVTPAVRAAVKPAYRDAFR